MKNSNLVSLSQWSKVSSQTKEEKTLARYYKLLSFSELISESMNLVAEIDTTKDEAEVFLKSKTLIQEFKARTNSDNFQMAQAMKQMALNLEVNLNLIRSIS